MDPFTKETALEHATVALSNVNFREPIVESGTDLQLPTVNRQWNNLTAKILSEIIEVEGADARNAVKLVGQQAVSEALPGLLVTALEETESLAPTGHIDTALSALVRYATVPLELLKPDVSHAPPLLTAEWATESLAGILFTHGISDTYHQSMHDLVARVQETPGITKEERELVVARSKFARHVKLLGLAAELIDNPAIDAKPGKDGVVLYELPSGAKISMDEAKLVDNQDLLDPHKWQSSRQIKDRVQSIKVGDKTYILKYRKTPTHINTHRIFGYKKGNSSANELGIAKHFADMGPIEKDDILLEWEKPVGYVEFPDGTQFCVFEYEPAIAKHDKPRRAIRLSILESPQAYEQEYEDIKERYKAILGIPMGLKALFSNDEHRELTFDEFAKLKAASMVFEAENLINRVALEQGYENDDVHGVGFDVILGNDDRLKLRAIGFDFEYYKKVSKWDIDTELYREKVKRETAALALNWTGESSGDDVWNAACFAMLESMGYELPNNISEVD